MGGLGNRLTGLRETTHTWGALRVVVVLGFAALGAWLVYSLAPGVLGLIFESVTTALTPSPAPDTPVGKTPVAVSTAADYRATGIATTGPLALLGALLGALAGCACTHRSSVSSAAGTRWTSATRSRSS